MIKLIAHGHCLMCTSCESEVLKTNPAHKLCTILLSNVIFFQECLTQQKPASVGCFAHSQKIVEEMEKIGWEK